MAGDPKNPVPGEMHIDATEVSDYVEDLDKDGKKGMRKEQPGYAEARDEVMANETRPDVAQRAAVSVEATTLLDLETKMARVNKFRVSALKMAEILEETFASLDNQRQIILSAIAGTIDQRAKLKGNEDLLAYYEKTRAYRSAAGVKAAKTRKKNKAVEPAK